MTGQGQLHKLQHIITNSTSTTCTKRDTNIEQQHRHQGQNRYAWSIYLENQWLLYAMQMPGLLKSYTQGNYMYMYLYECWTHPLGKKKPGYLLTGTLPTSCNGHPKISHPTYQWDNVYTDSGPVHPQPRPGTHLQLAMLWVSCARFKGKLSWQNLKNILGLKSLHRKNTIEVLTIKFVHFFNAFMTIVKLFLLGQAWTWHHRGNICYIGPLLQGL